MAVVSCWCAGEFLRCLCLITVRPCVYLYVCVRRACTDIASKSPYWMSTWDTFLQSDFKPSYFWFAHVNLLCLLVLTTLTVFGTHARAGTEGSVFVFTTLTAATPVALAWRLRALNDADKWKLPVLAATSGVVSFAALVNLVWFVALTNRTSTVGPTGLSYFQFVLCVLLAGVFVYSFWVTLERTLRESVVKPAPRLPTDIEASPTSSQQPAPAIHTATKKVAGAVPSDGMISNPLHVKSPSKH